jgi:hypothetical protein
MTTTIFADGIHDANVTSGVARLTLAQAGPDGKPMAVGQLVMPLVQLPAFVNGLANLLKQVETRMQAQQAAAPESSPAAGPDAFRFNGVRPPQ